MTALPSVETTCFFLYFYAFAGEMLSVWKYPEPFGAPCQVYLMCPYHKITTRTQSALPLMLSPLYACPNDRKFKKIGLRGRRDGESRFSSEAVKGLKRFVQARSVLSERFLSFEDFLERTAEADREFLPEEEVDRFPAVCCGMANGTGGWVVLGAAWDEDAPVVRGLSDPSGLERRLKTALIGDRMLSADTVSSFRILEAEGASLLIARVGAAEWYRRPVCVGDDYLRGVYRRIEGVDVVSGRRACFRFALDALERLRGESVVPGLTVSDLHEESVASFRDAVTARRPEWKALSLEAFLARTLVLDEGDLTQAGHLLLGKKGTRVRAVFLLPSGEEEIFEVRNLWRAYADLLPRFCKGLTPACAAALHECFVNALVHAEHDEGFVRVTGCCDAVCVENPGLSRSRRGESLCRNVRLMRMFQLAGAARGEGHGLECLHAYSPGFELRQDLLEFVTAAELELERIPLPPDVPEGGEALGLGSALPLISPETRDGEREQDAAEGAAEQKTSSEAPAQSASASEFLVAVSDGEAASEAGPLPLKTGRTVEKMPSELGEEPSAPMEAVQDEEPETPEALEAPNAGEVCGEAPAPAAPEPVTPEGGEPRAGKKFVFGNAAEELELAVAQLRRAEGVPSVPEAAPAGEDKL